VFAAGTKCSFSWSYLTRIRSLEPENVDESEFPDKRKEQLSWQHEMEQQAACESLSVFYKHQRLVFSPDLFLLQNHKLLHLVTFLWVTFLPLSPVSRAGW